MRQRPMNAKYPIPKPSNATHPMGFPRESVTRIVLIKPRATTVMIQPIHDCGRYRPVALINIPVAMTAGASDANASE